MNNIELIDDYLTNRLSGEDKVAFEAQISSDPSLKADLELQKQLIESVKNARAAELKSMLNQVQVPAGNSASFTTPIMRMAASIIGAGLMIAGVSYYFTVNKDAAPKMATSLEDSLRKVSPEEFEPLEEPVNPEPAKVKSIDIDEKANIETKENEADPIIKNTPNKPKFDLVDPTNEIEEGNKGSISNGKEEIKKPLITASQVAVEIEASNKKYPFHYQFNQGKLLLYGSFDKSLYEILELNGEKHSVFLFYKDSYYSLDENVHTITKLEPIKNEVLVNKLKEYRGR
jgi:hypothetical protein